MRMRSITRRLIIGVLFLELLAALLLIGVMAIYERHIHREAFDVMLRGRADSILGAVQEADDEDDSVVLDMAGLALPKGDFFNVDEAGHPLGRSAQWPQQQVLKALEKIKPNGTFQASVNGKNYRFIVIHGVRVVDPKAKNGGVSHPIRVIYGSSTQEVWHQMMKTIRFYAIATLVLLTVTGGVMAWSLRRGLAPLKELAEVSGRISAQQGSFTPPESARQTRELAPLASVLEAALGRLQEAFSQQRRFTSNAAHELKTDIAVAKSSLQLLSMRPRTVEEYQQGLEVCLADCLRLETTVQRMLVLARVESAASNAPQKTPSPKSDAATCALESVRQFTALAELSRVRVVLNAPENVIVPLDPNDCTILCSNLLHNALIHSKPYSVVNITVTSTGKWMSLTVQDYGDGVAPEALPHVFEPFYRGDLSRDRRSGSTGLGLAICKALCEGVGGSITLKSQPGSGTLVMVRLPIDATSLMSHSESVFSLA